MATDAPASAAERAARWPARPAPMIRTSWEGTPRFYLGALADASSHRSRRRPIADPQVQRSPLQRSGEGERASQGEAVGAVVGGERYLGTAELQRLVRRFDHPYHATCERHVELHRLTGTNSLNEIGQLESEGLVRLELRRQDVSASVREVIFTKRRRVLVDHAAIEQADRLGRAIVVDDHALTADQHRTPQLTRSQPAELDVDNDPGGEAHRHERDVGYPGNNRVASDCAHAGW